ncbi:MAG: sulfatase-like hydrolase/transferase, partial [Planctomycetaceae bacterium]|nr:sulfatase-like hydrolase/transferase [Planctomycetaceae bacterium]
MRSLHLLSIWAVLIFSIFSPKRGFPEERPNLLLIVADDVTWTDFGFTGNDEVQTPNLDQLRQEGMSLT